MKFYIIILTLLLGSHVGLSQLPDPGKFRYKDLKVFKIDTLQWEERINHYMPLDSVSHLQIFQDSLSPYYARPAHEPDQDFFYSWQATRRNLYELTVFSQREGEYCERIRYFIYDASGKLISTFRVAGRCADGGFYETAYGNFVNDSTYVLQSEDNYSTADVDDKDHIITYYEEKSVILPNGEIVRTQTMLWTETRPN